MDERDIDRDDRARVRRWEAAGRPLIPLSWDKSGELSAATDNFATLLRGTDPRWAPLRQAARDWVDTHCRQEPESGPVSAGEPVRPMTFSAYLTRIGADRAMQIVNQLTVGLGTLNRAIRPEVDERSTIQVVAMLASAYGILYETQHLLNGPLLAGDTHPFLPRADDRFPLTWRSTLAEPAGRDVIERLLAAVAAARHVREIATANGDVATVRQCLLVVLQTLLAVRDGLTNIAGAPPTTPLSPQSTPSLTLAAGNSELLDQLQDVLAQSWQRLGATRRHIEQSHKTLAQARSTSGNPSPTRAATSPRWKRR
jgi:hypothetical protein